MVENLIKTFPRLLSIIDLAKWAPRITQLGICKKNRQNERGGRAIFFLLVHLKTMLGFETRRLFGPGNTCTHAADLFWI
jgi:hypothetical protein